MKTNKSSVQVNIMRKKNELSSLNLVIICGINMWNNTNLKILIYVKYNLT